jgi:hypothetical protein
LEGVSAAARERLFPPPSIAPTLFSLLQESSVDGFVLRSIVVFKDDAPVLLLPLFETRFDLSSFMSGWIKKSLKAVGRLLPSVFQPRVLGVGMLEGEWSEIGIDPDLDQSTLALVWKMALSALQTLARERKSDIVAFYNFNQYGNLPVDVVTQFNRVRYRACARLQIDFTSIEEFLARLSRAARKHLRRKMRVAPLVRTIRSRTIAPFSERIYELYQETVERSPMALGAHNRLFFEKICERIPGAEYTLYFVQEKLIAFNLLIVKQEEMVDLYFCMEYGLGRTYNLYVLSWLENIRTCVDRKIPLYYAGMGTEKTKAHMGATFIPSYILFKHRVPMFDHLLVWQSTLINRILSFLRFWPAVRALNTVARKDKIEIYDERT